MRNNKRSAQFNCFSPPVMVATMTIESCLALYTAWRYKMTQLTRLVTLTLIMLAGFQLCEYFVCTGSVGHAILWSRLGFAAITALPPLGVHIMHVLAGKKAGRTMTLAYLSMAAFGAGFLLLPGAFSNYQCTGNYVVFHLRPHLGGVYWMYYFGWLFLGVALGARWANQAMAEGKRSRNHLQAIRGLIVGWFVFIIPTAVANAIDPQSREAIPSVMCGFAVLFALILALYILPRMVPMKQPLTTDKKLA